jgi:hypothetical protein
MIYQASNSPTCAVISGQKDAAARTPNTSNSGKEIRAGDCKRHDIRVRHAGIDCCPARAVISGKKDPARISPCKEIQAAYGKTKDTKICQAVGSPIYATISGKKNTAAARKEIRAAYGKRIDITIR